MCRQYGFFLKMPVRLAPWARKKVSGTQAYTPSVTGMKRARARARARDRARTRERERERDRRKRTPRQETPDSGHSKKNMKTNLTHKSFQGAIFQNYENELYTNILREFFSKSRNKDVILFQNYANNYQE